ncbi:MAG: TIGR03905 family TSCPD domain-containing protein [Muribaculaceae bacterium]|nr:TIGR03905 family TSCPD domain-containing protein [Muribaculaceae bacterium]
MNYKFKTSGVCSRSIEFEIDGDGILHNLSFDGGCQGNTGGISALAEGRPAREVMKCLRGIDCKGRGTSCPDNLSRAIEEALKEA